MPSDRTKLPARDQSAKKLESMAAPTSVSTHSADRPLAGSLVRSEGALDPARIHSRASRQAFPARGGFRDSRRSESQKSEISVKIRNSHKNQLLLIFFRRNDFQVEFSLFAILTSKRLNILQ